MPLEVMNYSLTLHPWLMEGSGAAPALLHPLSALLSTSSEHPWAAWPFCNRGNFTFSFFFPKRLFYSKASLKGIYYCILTAEATWIFSFFLADIMFSVSLGTLYFWNIYHFIELCCIEDVYLMYIASHAAACG